MADISSNHQLVTMAGAGDYSTQLETITGMAYLSAGVVAAGRPAGMPLFASYYYDALLSHAAAGWAGSGMTAGRLIASPVYIPHAITVDRLGINVTTGVGSALGKAGIYEMGSNGRPGALVVQGGSNLDCSSITAVEHTINQVLAGGKWYWFAITSDSAISLYQAAPTGSPLGLGTTNSSITKLGSYFLTLGSLTLPDPFGTPTGTLGSLYRVFFRIA